MRHKIEWSIKWIKTRKVNLLFMIWQLTPFILKLHTRKMKIYYIFSSSVIGELCCFEQWTQWEYSSLTCGEFCKQSRQRNILVTEDNFLGSAFSWVSDAFGASDNCNEKHSTCPDYESECVSHVNIDCREFNFLFFQSFFNPQTLTKL